MASTLYQYDLLLVHFVNQVWICPLADTFFAAISSYSLFRIPLATLIMALLIFGRFKERVFLALMFFCLLIGDAGINNGLKHLVNRPRPDDALPGIRIVTLKGVEISDPGPNPPRGGHSFPSSHTANNVALALVATTLYGEWAYVLWIWAALIGYARVYTGAHYPSDVLAGCVISLTYTWSIINICEWAWRKYGSGLAQKIYARHPSLFSEKQKKLTGDPTRK